MSLSVRWEPTKPAPPVICSGRDKPEKAQENGDNQLQEDIFLGQPQLRTSSGWREEGRWQRLYLEQRPYCSLQGKRAHHGAARKQWKLQLPLSKEVRKVVVTSIKMSSLTENVTFLKGSCWSLLQTDIDLSFSGRRNTKRFPGGWCTECPAPREGKPWLRRHGHAWRAACWVSQERKTSTAFTLLATPRPKHNGGYQGGEDGDVV